jgi:hypothetical protein
MTKQKGERCSDVVVAEMRGARCSDLRSWRKCVVDGARKVCDREVSEVKKSSERVSCTSPQRDKRTDDEYSRKSHTFITS